MFSLDKDQAIKLGKWFDEQEEKIKDKPQGCCGGVYTYMFTPTSLGCVIKVENCITKDVCDLSDYESW